MSLDDARNLALIIGTVVAALTLMKAVFEYARQNAQKRAEHYLELRENTSKKTDLQRFLSFLKRTVQNLLSYLIIKN